MNKDKSRKLPDPDKYASCPNSGEILSFYQGVFDSVFIMLHPFYKPTKIDIDTYCERNQLTKHDEVALCEIVSWEEISKKSGLNSIAKIDIALRSSIGGLNSHFENSDLVKGLGSFIDEEEILPPDEGCLSPFLENRLFECINKIGYNWLWVGDEFCTKRSLHHIEDLINNDLTEYGGMTFTPDKQILITTHWDSHFSFLCSKKEIIDHILAIDNFEGFFCDTYTEVYWSLKEEKN